MSEIKAFEALRDQYREMGLSTDLMDADADFTIFRLADAFGDRLPFVSPVHRLNFFVFLFVKWGKGRYTIDEHTFPLEPGTVYFTNPGHLRSYVWENTDEVYLITLGESFLKENVNADVFEEFPFLLSETFPGRVLPPDAFLGIERIYEQIYDEYTQRSPFRMRIIAALFVALLLKLKEYFWLDYNPIYEGNRSSLIVKNFKRQLEHHYRLLGEGKASQVFRVQDYADAQHLHPNYLSTVIKSKTGRSISAWIADKTVSEAKSLLQNTNLSVKEIAYRLGFSETAHFSNFFKKHAKLSPAAYRTDKTVVAS